MAETALPDEFETSVYAKVTWRILPFIGLCYLVAYLDRVNVGFAKLQMESALSLSDVAYGVGAGIFFIGYFLFEVPSNLILHKVGPRRWIARIMVSWGLISGAMAFMKPIAGHLGISVETTFYAMRFLLGLAEAGFFPGIILYFSYWYPSHRQSRVIGLFFIAQPVAFILGAPLSGAIMDVLRTGPLLDGWQWLYILEGAPSILLGFVVLFYLSDSIAEAGWLAPTEKEVLRKHLDAEGSRKSDYPLLKLFSIGAMWAFTAIYLLVVIGVYGINFWLPTIVQAAGVSSFLDVGLITAIPYIIGVVMLVVVTRHAEHVNEKRWHTASAAVLGGLGLIFSAFVTNVWATIFFISIANAGALVTMALFWSFPSSILTGAAAAAAIAAINSVGNLGGFIGPTLMGWLTELLGSASSGLTILGALMIAAGILVALTCRDYGVKQTGEG